MESQAQGHRDRVPVVWTSRRRARMRQVREAARKGGVSHAQR